MEIFLPTFLIIAWLISMILAYQAGFESRWKKDIEETKDEL